MRSNFPRWQPNCLLHNAHCRLLTDTKTALACQRQRLCSCSSFQSLEKGKCCLTVKPAKIFLNHIHQIPSLLRLLYLLLFPHCLLWNVCSMSIFCFYCCLYSVIKSCLSKVKLFETKSFGVFSFIKDTCQYPKAKTTTLHCILTTDSKTLKQNLGACLNWNTCI